MATIASASRTGIVAAMVVASITRTGAIVRLVTRVFNSVSAFSNSVSKCIGYPSAEPYWSRAVPLVIVASRSGDCNNMGVR